MFIFKICVWIKSGNIFLAHPVVDDETKKATDTTVLKYPKRDFRIGKSELQKYMKTAFCKDSSTMN